MALINKKQEYQDQEAWSDNVQKLKGYKEFVEKVEYWANKKDGWYNNVIQGSYEIVFDNELGWCVDVDDKVSFGDLDIEEIPFQFRKVSGWFSCSRCKELTSLKGCPVYVGDHFGCSYCDKLTSLEGCPKEVKHIFFCNNCKNITSLEWCPKEVGGDFGCGGCRKLTSLEGCPEEVGGDFNCRECGKKFTEEYVRSLCNVKGNIYI